jgi:hypothetical protein
MGLGLFAHETSSGGHRRIGAMRLKSKDFSSTQLYSIGTTHMITFETLTDVFYNLSYNIYTKICVLLL